MVLRISTLLISSLALASQVSAQLPYNPVQLVLSTDGTKVYQFAPQGSQVSFSYFDVSTQLTSSSTPTAIHQPIPFETTSRSFLPIADKNGITVLTGNCQQTSNAASLWRFKFNKDGRSGLWNSLTMAASDTTLSASYLSGGFSYSANGSDSDITQFFFGGMCPTGKSNASSWTSQATYSNTLYSVTSATTQSPYQLSVTGVRSAPIAEAGLSITPLSPVTTRSAAGQTSQQQNFVLLGGHTQNAFINMSQVALFSLPEASWAFVGINAPVAVTGELARRDPVVVEPRSGHTALLSEDGSKIVVFGGWVGDVTNPATPQLAVLQLGQGYGGSSAWQWTVPKQSNSPVGDKQGIYGHGAVLLPGNVMMVAGGTNIGSSKSKRSTQNAVFYNLDTGAWSTTYRNSTMVYQTPDMSKKVGLGAGLGLGLTAVIAVLVVWFLYRRRMRKKRTERERYLRELAFGSEIHPSNSRVGSVTSRRVGQPEMRSVSWGSRQEQEIESPGFSFPWANQRAHVEAGAERTALEVPSPTRGLRKSLSIRGPAAFGRNFFAPTTGPGSVFRIDEVEEEGSVKSGRVKSPAGSRMSDPFKDPPEPETSTAAEERKREVQGWVEDWQSAAASMNVTRKASQSRTCSNLSQAHSSSESSSYRTGRESPEKSDRTGSNLSERSDLSFQKSTGGISRQTSGRSVSAGYALFANAAAAMGRLGGISGRETNLERSESKRSISLNTTNLPRRVASGSQRPYSGAESSSLLRDRSPTKHNADISPIRDYKNYSRTSSLTSQRKKMGILGSMKRVLTGTSHVDVQAQVEHFEEKVDESSQHNHEPEMSEITPTGPAFWRGKRGAKDWDEGGAYEPSRSTAAASTTIPTSTTLAGSSSSSSAAGKRRSTIDTTGGNLFDTDNNNDNVYGNDDDEEDWDIETAVQKRVVQVMFTMPKERLRVVNADSLSILSGKSGDVGGAADNDDRDRDGVDRGRDGDGGDGEGEEQEGIGKGKEVGRKA